MAAGELPRRFFTSGQTGKAKAERADRKTRESGRRKNNRQKREGKYKEEDWPIPDGRHRGIKA